MTRVPRSVTLACLTLMAAVGAVAQVRSSVRDLPSEATIENWLLSDDPRLVAWGAHDVLVSRNVELDADLLTLVTEWEPLDRQDVDGTPTPLSAEQENKRDAMAAVLDALIQLDVPVPGDTLRRLATDFPNDVAILLSRMTPEDAGPLALDFYHSPAEHGYGLQYVSAALLAQHPPSGFAADLLGGIKVRADIFVVLPDSPSFGFGGSGCAACLVRTKPQRRNWPPIGQYSLAKEKTDRSLLLVSGVDPIYATRQESDSYRDPCGGPSLGPEQRRQLIAGMLNVSGNTIRWNVRPSATIAFQSDEQFRRELLQFIGNEEQKYRQTAIALAHRGLMSDAEVQQSIPNLQIYTNDMRGESAAPIQNLAPLPANVEWLNNPLEK